MQRHELGNLNCRDAVSVVACRHEQVPYIPCSRFLNKINIFFFYYFDAPHLHIQVFQVYREVINWSVKCFPIN